MALAGFVFQDEPAKFVSAPNDGLGAYTFDEVRMLFILLVKML